MYWGSSTLKLKTLVGSRWEEEGKRKGKSFLPLLFGSISYERKEGKGEEMKGES